MSQKNKLMMNGVPIDLSAAPKSSDGALILNAAPMRVGDYEYYGFELYESERRGYRWDDKLIGRIEQADAEACLKQFKALPVTDEHIFIGIGERKDLACGTILKDGVLDGDLVRTEAEIHEPKTIVKITASDATELSIGFYSSIEWNENKQDGDPDFFIRDIDLNHVAVVKQGRAGPEARLSNHKTKLKEDSKMEKITIGGVEFEVDKAVAQEFARLTKAETDLTNNIGSVTTERDQARGQLASAKSELKNAKDGASTEAVKMANAHTQFIGEATRLGHDTKALALGNYDEIALKREILKNNGVEIDKDASDDTVRGAWIFAVANKSEAAKQESALDDLDPAPTVSTYSPAEAAEKAVQNSFFNASKKKAKEG